MDFNSFNNLSQSEKEGLINAMRRISSESDTSGFVNIAGDTMTGDLVVPGLGASSTASIADALNVGGTLTVVGQTVGKGLALTSLASISATLNVGNTITATSGVTLNPVLIAQQTVLGGPTIAPIRVVASTASQAFFDFRGAVLSTASINLAANKTAGFIRVWIDGTGGKTVGYVPIFVGVTS